MSGVATWWDGVELWTTGLPFVAQVVLVLAVVGPLCALGARGLDHVVGAATGLLGRVRPEREVPAPPPEG